MLTRTTLNIDHMLTSFTRMPFLTLDISYWWQTKQLEEQNNFLNTVNSRTHTPSCQKKVVFSIQPDRIGLLNRKAKTALFSLAGVHPPC